MRFSQSQILAQALGVRGLVAHFRGDLPGAERLLSQAVGELRRLGWMPVQAEYLGELAAVAIAMGKLEQAETWAPAAMLHAGAARVLHTTGSVHPAPRARELQREWTAIRTTLGQTAYDAARAEGESMNDRELIDYAQRETLSSTPPPRGRTTMRSRGPSSQYVIRNT